MLTTTTYCDNMSISNKDTTTKDRRTKAMIISTHYKKDRTARENKIREIGEGQKLLTSLVYRNDKSYPYDIEKHVVTSTGIIIVYNYYTDKLVTKLIARAGQVKRLYWNEYKQAPKALVSIAMKHEALGYNLL